jgi:D-alanyl-D-alanine endopeptidase (penicillin-binding protein 7)
MLKYSMKRILCLASVLLALNPAWAKHATKPEESILVVDQNGQVLKEQEADMVRPIASLSKLMTALLASEQDLDEQLGIPIKREMQSSIPVRVKNLSRKELITLALVKSDNLAAKVLCDNIPNCVIRMNEKAQEIGMTDTIYVEPTGLDKGNVSTARDLVKLVVIATSNPILTKLSSLPKVEIPLDRGFIKVRNTNPLISKVNVVLSKTGWTKPAGGCMVLVIASEEGKKIFIILGSQNTRTRVSDMQHLVAKL